MEYLIGFILGVLIAAASTLIGFDRDRSFYPTVLIVISTYYVLFAVMGAAYNALYVEILIASVFLLLAILGYRYAMWFVVLGLIAHGVFDFNHDLFITNEAVPDWWPGFCLVIDITLAIWLMTILVSRVKH